MVKKKIKAKSKKYYKNKLVKVFELYIRYRDNWTCFCCGKYLPGDTTYMHCGHLISRRHEKTQFDEENCLAQCAVCNNAHRFYPERYTDKYVQKFGKEQYHALVERSRGVSTLKKCDMVDMLDHYTERLNTIKNKEKSLDGQPDRAKAYKTEVIETPVPEVVEKIETDPNIDML